MSQLPDHMPQDRIGNWHGRLLETFWDIVGHGNSFTHEAGQQQAWPWGVLHTIVIINTKAVSRLNRTGTVHGVLHQKRNKRHARGMFDIGQTLSPSWSSSTKKNVCKIHRTVV